MSDNPTPAPAKPKSVARGSYVVRSAAIFLADGVGVPGRRADPGDVVELTAPEARHYVKLGLLDPHVPDVDDVD